VKVFISWSGEPSRTVGRALRKWLPDIIQSIHPWMSEQDLEAGARWNERVQRELSDTRFGILCITQSNMLAPWLLFEAGALAKTLHDTYVCPYLIGLEPSNLPQGPLAQFQAKRANRNETHDLVRAVNQALGENALDTDRVDRSFERWWPDLENILTSLSSQQDSTLSRRSPEDMLEEVIVLTRSLERQVASELGAVRHDVNVLDRFKVWEKVEERFARIEKALKNIDGYTDLNDIASKLDDVESKLDDLETKLE
jgi:TIR domain-containing protein